jgi:hypothetical protein
VNWAVPVTRPQPPPQAVIALQVSPLAFWTKAQTIYVPLPPEAHSAKPAFETVTAVVALPSKEHAPQVAVSGVTGDGGVLKYPIAVNWYAPLAGAVADVGLRVTDWAVRVAAVPQARAIAARVRSRKERSRGPRKFMAKLHTRDYNAARQADSASGYQWVHRPLELGCPLTAAEVLQRTATLVTQRVRPTAAHATIFRMWPRGMRSEPSAPTTMIPPVQ